MTRFLSDQQKTVMLFESGTYGNASGAGQWPGMVQSHDIVESQNVQEVRFLGQLNRNVGIFVNGPLDFKGTMTYYPQDWKMLGFALGSITTTSGTNNTYAISEVNTNVRGNAFTSGTLNPFISFQLEESRAGGTANQNFMRTLKGCTVDTYTINVNQSEPITCEVGFIAQVGSWFSGASTSVTAGSNRPYLWSDTTFTLPDSVSQEPVKSMKFTVGNNLVGPHYINGSRNISTPYPLNRDYSVDITQDLESTMAGSLYNTFFQGGSQFNAIIDVNNTFDAGSRHLILTLSGCRMKEMTVPAKLGGIVEVSYTFVPGSVSAIAYDRSFPYTAF